VSTSLPPFIEALHDPACYPHPVTTVAVVETHISWVLLTGPYAYKIKKPVALGFLDFSTLTKRRDYCEAELRLNRRLAPSLYLEIVAITGTPAQPRLGGPGEPFEYAVKMVQFPQEAQLDRMLARGTLRPDHIDALAQELAGFHARITVADTDSRFGAPEQVYHPMKENFDQIRPRVASPFHPQLERLQTWSECAHARLTPALIARRCDGFIRECHGDAHLGNMAWLDDKVVIFDCLEFNENLRWIDVMSEVAFTAMDLDDRERPDLARRFLNDYLEHSGDYAALELLRFYQVYRALVRAKVAVIRLNQAGLSTEERGQIDRQYRSYADLAERYTQTVAPALLITHGLSGAGKTSVSQGLVEGLGAVRLRSDIERKRLHGLAAQDRSHSGLDRGLYTAGASEQTYQRLAQLARTVLASGFPVIVDATFLKHSQRIVFLNLAETLHVPFAILDVHAPEATLRARIGARERVGADASEATGAVLERQLAIREPLTSQELACSMSVDGENPPTLTQLRQQLERRLLNA
jgi:aminoglycoside phosphotransferase family enzyme/predicted kinase